MKKINIDEMAMFCKRKGFVFPSAEIYGGLAGFWDFGPLGAELKKNLKDSWWKYHVHLRQDIVGMDGCIITHPKVWKASGHVDCFSDKMIYCKKHKKQFRADQIIDEILKISTDGLKEKELLEIFKENEKKFKDKGYDFDLNLSDFNLMFKTFVGPNQREESSAFLRPETAQLIFADFKQIIDTNRVKLPFGIAQMGRSFRNEIAPRNFLFRCREFEQMEIEYFINPEKKKECPYEIQDLEISVYSADMQEKNKEAEKMKISDALKKEIIMLPWHAYWLSTELSWFKSLGANMDNFRIRQHMKDEKSHYATDTWDLEYNFPFGFKELQGIADRGNFDLSQHQKFSSKSMEMRDEESGKKFIPMVISEPSLGVERAFLVFLFDAYSENSKGEVVLKLDPKLAPNKAAIFPLIKKDEKQVEIAKKIYLELKQEWKVDYDDSGSVGKRYARNDEIGTPYCITVDPESVSSEQVTIRDRDTTKQIKVSISDVKQVLRQLLSGEIEFEKAGKLVQ